MSSPCVFCGGVEQHDPMCGRAQRYPSPTPWTDAAIRALGPHDSRLSVDQWQQVRRIEREHAQMLDVLRRIRIALADVLPEDIPDSM